MNIKTKEIRILSDKLTGNENGNLIGAFTSTINDNKILEKITTPNSSKDSSTYFAVDGILFYQKQYTDICKFYSVYGPCRKCGTDRYFKYKGSDLTIESDMDYATGLSIGDTIFARGTYTCQNCGAGSTEYAQLKIEITGGKTTRLRFHRTLIARPINHNSTIFNNCGLDDGKGIFTTIAASAFANTSNLKTLEISENVRIKPGDSIQAYTEGKLGLNQTRNLKIYNYSLHTLFNYYSNDYSFSNNSYDQAKLYLLPSLYAKLQPTQDSSVKLFKQFNYDTNAYDNTSGNCVYGFYDWNPNPTSYEDAARGISISDTSNINITDYAYQLPEAIYLNGETSYSNTYNLYCEGCQRYYKLGDGYAFELLNDNSRRSITMWNMIQYDSKYYRMYFCGNCHYYENPLTVGVDSSLRGRARILGFGNYESSDSYFGV